MTRRAKKRQPTQTPPEWADILREHDHELTRVRMLWRRGGGRYRPIVLVNLALEDLSGEQSRYDDSGQERATIDDTMRAMIGDERSAWHQMDRVKDSLLTRLTNDEERLSANLEKTTAAAPALIEDACIGLGISPATLFESFELGRNDVARELIDLVSSRSPNELRLLTRIIRAVLDELDELKKR